MALSSVYEEITFRGVLNLPLWLFQRIWIDRTAKSTQERQQMKAEASKRWIYFKGILFGILHIRNHILPGIEGSSPENQLHSIIWALSHVSMCAISSITMYDRLAEKHGLAAAIGAHVAKNQIILLFA